MFKRPRIIGLGVGLGLAAAIAAPAGVSASATRTSCSATEFWSASDPQQAWLPGGVLAKPRAAGKIYFYYDELVRGRTPADLTVGAQLGVPAGDALSVHRLPAQVNAVTGATTRVRFTTHSTSKAAYSKLPNPLHESARPELFVTGWRVQATLYHQSCTGSAATRVRTRPIFLFQRRYVLIVGWVGAHTSPHPLYGRGWAHQSVVER